MLLMTLILTSLLQTQDARAILRTAHEKQLERWAQVENYTLMNSLNGLETPEYREKIVVRPTAGADSTGVAFRVVPITEWSRRPGPSGEPMSDGQLKAMAKGMATGYRMLAGGARSGQLSEGMPMASPIGNHMAGLLDTAALFMDFTAAAVDSISDGRDEAGAQLKGARAFAAVAQLVGREQVEGRDAWLLRATGLADTPADTPMEQAENAPAFVLDVTSLWLDAAEYVPLRLKMDGRMTADGQTTAVTIELLEFDYRAVDGLYLSHRQVMRITGMMQAMSMDARQKKEMEKMQKDLAKARVEMARMERQLASMPPAQRRMIEGQMNKMKAQIDMMTGDGVFQTELLRRVHSVNQGPPRDWMPMQGMAR